MMVENVIQTEALTMYYGRHRGIVDVDLAIRPGEVFGFLGPNGAGKTTTLRILLDIIRPTSGRATIFGRDCQKEGPALRQRVGYLPGELSMPDGMTGRRYLDTLSAIRGTADAAYGQELCERLQMDTSRKIREYSRGNKQKLGLIGAMMARPELLILDEPTGGLDPLVQQTVLELVRETRDEGRTVFFCSHILPEVQAVCDRVGIIREGRLVAVERVDTLVAQQFRRLRLTLERDPAGDAFAFEGVTELQRADHSVTLEIRQNLHAVMAKAVEFGVVDIESQPVTLEEIFLAYYGAGNHRANAVNGGHHA
ncbi:MAG: ABC transporter ATP-binding protein [Anaerolineales bacterium]|nr:ABC transporter ATP-binding protein [Anaerolineales bacterium]